MKKIKIYGITLFFVLALVSAAVLITQGISGFADHTESKNSVSANELFSDQEIEDSGYLFNYDDSADYVYLDFAGSTGYAIFAQETLELLEYATVGEFPYAETNGKKYYGGPTAYFHKSGSQFVNVFTDETISISEAEAETCAQAARKSISVNANTVSEREVFNELSDAKLKSMDSLKIANASDSPMDPPLDEKNWISPTEGATYIANQDYFLTKGAAPRHGLNSNGTCTTVAIQLMLSYNNYYNDRRIIPNQFLFGTGTKNPERNPNFCADPTMKTSYTLGSNQDFHDMLLNHNIVHHLIDSKQGVKTYLDGRGVDYTLNCINRYPQYLPAADVIAELDAGRPLVLTTAQYLNGTPHGNQRKFNHAVIAYGYQSFAAYESQDDSNVYTGYIVHMGWDSNGRGSDINIWTNSVWYYSSLSLTINHTHNYVHNTGRIINGSDMELRCECGHRIIDKVYSTDDSGEIITGFNFGAHQKKTVAIPKELNGKRIKGVAANAFRYENQLEQVIIDGDLEIIGFQAFAGSINLETVQINGNVQNISGQAFVFCLGLRSVKINGTVGKIGEEAFQGCRQLSKFFSDGIAELEKGTFQSCGNLDTLESINGIKIIKDFVFDGCSKLTFDFELYNVESIGKFAFRDCDSLTSLPAMNRLKSIGDYAFQGCGNFVSLGAVPNLQSIGNYAFLVCSNFVSFGAVPNLQSIGDYAFQECSNFVSFGAVPNLQSIGDYAFQKCSNFISLGAVPNLQSIGDEAFANCLNLTEISSATNLKYIGHRAFQYCDKLKEVDFGENLVTIGDYAFQGCYSILSLSKLTQLKEIGEGAFA